MSTESYRWHYDYSRILWDAGFNFDNQKSLKTFDRNCIGVHSTQKVNVNILCVAVLDIERIIRERDIRIVEHHIQNILEYSLDVEEARILDPTFVKIFRLSQLAVEYLNSCKQYLDSTTDTLKKELQKSSEENDDLKHNIVQYELELSKLRKKVKDLKSSLYIHQKYHPPETQATIGRFRCNLCKKGFLNAEYLKKHLLKRHPDSTELQHFDTKLGNTEEDSENSNPKYKAETEKLEMEIKALKEKLNNTERFFHNAGDNISSTDQEEAKGKTEEYYTYVSKLHDQFELLKSQIESEMQALKSQKFEHDKYEELFEKLFTKLAEKKDTEPSTSKIVETILSPKTVNTEATQTNETLEKDSQQTIKTNEIPEQEIQTTEIIPESQSRDSIDVDKLKQDMERELDKRAKENIDKLGQQISDNIANTFDVLQNRLETFWGKLQEIEANRQEEQKIITTKKEIITVSPKKLTQTLQKVDLRDSPQKFIPKPAKRIQISPVKKIDEITKEIIKVQEEIKKQENITTSESDSETESSRQDKIEEIPSVFNSVQKNDKLARNLIAELKTKVEERNAVNEHKKSPEKPTKPAPTVKQIYSKNLKNESSSESESISETESESETESPMIIKPSKTTVSSKRPTTNTTEGARSSGTGISTLQNRSITSLENALRMNPEILIQLRSDMIGIVANRLKDLGIDPEWSRIPDKTYKQKAEIVTHHRNMAVKNVKSFLDIRKGIINNLESQIKELKDKEPKDYTTLEQKPSRFKNLLQNVRNKAKSIINYERPTTPSAPVYKLSVHRHHSAPAIKQSQNEKKTTRSKHTVVRNQKPKQLAKTMYDTDSEADSAPQEYKRLTPIKSEVTKSDSSLDVVDISDNIPENVPKNLAQSVDSVLEMKRELALQLQKELTAQIRQTENKSSSLETVENRDEVVETHTNIIQEVEDISSSDLETNETKDEEKIQKGVLKNITSTNIVKKKVLFDLHSDAKTSETNDEQKIETKPERAPPIKKTIVRANPLFKTNDWNSSSSLESLEDIKNVPKQTFVKAQSDTISTKAVINVSTKQNKAQDDISDWEISDIN